MQRDDILWKAILEDVGDDFLRFSVKDAESIFDFERGFEYLDKELEQLFPPEGDYYAPKHVDKLIKVFTKKNTEEWILVHVEVQGKYEKDFAARMFQYYYRILDSYKKQITAFAIFTDGNKRFHPKEYNRSFIGTSVSYRFNTCKILEQHEAELLQSNNPFAMVVLTVRTALLKKKVSEDELLGLKIELAKKLLSKSVPKPKIRALMNFLRYYVRFEKPDTTSNFEKQIEIITQKSKTMGIEEFLLDRAKLEGKLEGKSEGIELGKEMERQENRSTFVKNLLMQTDFSDEKIACLADVQTAFVKKIRGRL